jgi:hypothetical protein
LRSGEVRVFRAREVLRLWLRASASGRRCRGDTDGRLAALKEAMLAVESGSAGKDDGWLLRLCRVTGQV